MKWTFRIYYIIFMKIYMILTFAEAETYMN